MKFWLSLFCLAAGLAMATANPVSDNPVLKLLAGEWTGEGKLIDADGHEQPVKETWTGKFTDGGNFAMSGNRTLDQLLHEFAWEFYPNGDLIEGQMKISEPQLDLRFEVAISEADRSVTMKVPTTASGGLMTIVNTVSADGKSISGTVEIKDDNGVVTSSGKVEHRRKE
ncbi:MAG: hypothetical protein KDM91_15800 [Verrucomicrobiae bacterium]|nr:hypothetical protein [Verrucomicrobiae bacterium]MCP5539124.1 hypothetical protein [Akkermansiaceae bacterium]MCP5549775.1 hypothetical protein [Akkermansiaceae bacterium]